MPGVWGESASLRRGWWWWRRCVCLLLGHAGFPSVPLLALPAPNAGLCSSSDLRVQQPPRPARPPRLPSDCSSGFISPEQLPLHVTSKSNLYHITASVPLFRAALFMAVSAQEPLRRWSKCPTSQETVTPRQEGPCPFCSPLSPQC